MTYVYEFLAIGWMVAAISIALDRPEDATFAAGLSIAMGTLALVHEHRDATKRIANTLHRDKNVLRARLHN